MRINKYISHNSRYSRREADDLIKSGFVKINKQIASLNDTVKKNDKVSIKGKLINEKKIFTVIVYNKAKGELVSKRDDRGRKTIYDSLPRRFLSFLPVGRLDYASEGLLLLSDSVKVVSALMNSDLERKYYLKIRGNINEKVIEAMQNGLEIVNSKKGAHAKTKISSMKISPFLEYEILGSSGGYTKLKVLINEGKNRELRRFFAFFDLEVVELKRVSFGVVDLGMLASEKYRFLSKGEYDKLRDFLEYKRQNRKKL